MYLSSESITVHCTDMYTVSSTALYGKRSYTNTLGKYSSDHCNPVPMIRVVGHSTYDATLTAHTQATCLLLKYERVVGIQTVSTTPSADKYWRFLSLVSHLPTRTVGRYLYSVLQIVKCLSDASRDSAAAEALVKVHRWSFQ